MKRLYNLLFLVCMACIACSCSGMFDNIQPFLDQGETIYVGKLDSLKACPGKNRIRIEGKMMYGVNQVKCEVNYLDPVSLEAKSQVFAVERQNLEEEYSFMLDNLAEGQYDFSVVTYDSENNYSIPTTVSAYVYGDMYIQTLTNRICQVTPEQVQDGEGNYVWRAVMEWNISRGDGVKGCNVEYEQEDGSMKTLYVPVDETQTYLEGFKSEGKLRYNTEYQPVENTIDLFVTEWKELTLPKHSYKGLSLNLTSLYVKNAGHPIKGYNVSNNWGYPYDWKWNEVMTTSNGAGGAGFATYGNGIIQFETTRWSQGTYSNGKVWQTITLPEGKYEFRVEVANLHQGNHDMRFVVAKGEELPDTEEIDANSLTNYRFTSGGRTYQIPAFELTVPTKLTFGWVVSFYEVCKNVEFKSVRLYSVAE